MSADLSSSAGGKLLSNLDRSLSHEHSCAARAVSESLAEHFALARLTTLADQLAFGSATVCIVRGRIELVKSHYSLQSL